MIKDHLARALKKYGNTVTVTRGGVTRTAKAFVQPLRKVNRLYLRDRYTPAGFFDNCYRLYIGDPKIPLCYGDSAVIGFAGDRYSVVNAENYLVGDESLYIWAILRKIGDTEEDDYDVCDR